MERRESEEKCTKDGGGRGARRKSSILISRVCSSVIINNDCRCVTWMFMNAILTNRHQVERGKEEETTEGSTGMAIVGGG